MTCPCLLQHCRNPRLCYTTAGTKVLVYDCGVCGSKDEVYTLARPDPADCGHPARSLRYDGQWEIGTPRAAVTCLDCGTSLSLPARADVGGALGHPAESDVESLMSPETAASASQMQRTERT